ncbi:NAD-dependent epimerase/dehydratase family protein [Candidatus Woesearchaeota archaeon]|nr:NAD-dependent epimerase/dehydratase family protein [Candidatus Woesearchaeota archaeon]
MKSIRNLLVKKNQTIKKAMRVIDLAGIKMAVVTDNNSKLCGVVTDGDIRRGIIKGISINEKVSSVMNTNPISLNLNSSFGERLSLLKSKNLIGMPIVDKDKKVRDFVLLTGASNVSSYKPVPKISKKLNRILVIGGGGYIGSILVENLLSQKYRVNVLDRFLYVKNSLKKFENNSNLKIIKGDTRNISDITKALTGVDAVVHMAEIVGDPACALDTKKTQEINYIATKTIASVCKHFQINRMLYASSCSVYGASEGNKLLNEKSPLKPVSLYAKMKIASENALTEMQDENFLPTILRFATVFGFSHRPRFDLVVNLLTAKALRDKKITIFGGDQWRPNVHVKDISESIIRILESPIEKTGGQIYNIGIEKNNCTINQIGKLIKKQIPDTQIIIQDKDIDKRNYRVDFNKLRTDLDINLKNDIICGINEIKNALINNPEIDYQHNKYSNIKYLQINYEN